MMSAGLLILIAFGVFLFFILPTIAFIVWLLSFNKRGIILNEVGEDENDAIVNFTKLKITNDVKVGQILKFFPFSPYKVAKRFDSRDWTSMKEKNKLREGIILYRQGDNYRPVEFKKDEQGFYLKVRDEDNRKFLMQHEIMIARKHNETTVIKYAVVSFFIFIAFISFLTIAFMWWIMDANTKQIIISKGAQVISS